MRNLNPEELRFVTGACYNPCRPAKPVKDKCKPKGNNGYGNGGGDGSPNGKQDCTR